MRGRALFGGVLVLAAVVAFHQPERGVAGGAADRGPGCGYGTGYFCEAVTGLSRSLSNPIFPTTTAADLPPAETPGAIDPRVTPANIDATICRPGYAQSVRPPYSVTGPLKSRLMMRDHPGEAAADYELDHLIPISIGGAPLDQRDLWLQPRRGHATAGDKNTLAYVLWRLVCDHRLPLATAQGAISRDWTAAYQTYATPENVARYHFRHARSEVDRPAADRSIASSARGRT